MPPQTDQPPAPKQDSTLNESAVIRERGAVAAASAPQEHSSEAIEIRAESDDRALPPNSRASTDSTGLDDQVDPVQAPSGEVIPEKGLTNSQDPTSLLPRSTDSAGSMAVAQPPKTPWWKTAKAAPVWVALVTLIGPVSTGVHAVVSGYNDRLLADRQFHSEQNLAKEQHSDAVEMAKVQQQHDITFKYFQLAVDPSSSPELQQRVLRYLANPDLGIWANEELGRVDAYIEVKKDRDRLEQLVFEIATKAAGDEKEREQLRRSQTKLQKELTAANQELQNSAIPGGDQVRIDPVANSEDQTTTLRCMPGTITVEFQGKAEAYRCGGKPSGTAYIGITGLIYWSVAEGKTRFTCLCRRG